MAVKKSLQDLLPLGRHMAILTKLYIGALTKSLEHLEIERHYSVIILIGNTPSNCTQQYISDTLMIDKASMVRIIDYLVKKEYIKRVVNKKDRREHLVELTPKAKKALPEIHQAIDNLNKLATRGMNKTQTLDFYNNLHTICNNLENLPAHLVTLKFKTSKRT